MHAQYLLEQLGLSVCYLLCLTDLNWFLGRLTSTISAQTSQKGIEYTKV